MDNAGISSGHRALTRDEVLKTIERLGGSQAEKQAMWKYYYNQIIRDTLLHCPFFPGKTLRKIMRSFRDLRH